VNHARLDGLRAFLRFGGFVLVCACAGVQVPLAQPAAGALRDTGLCGSSDPTVRGARLFPEVLDEAHGWGIEPGGGVRAIVAGLRLVSTAQGSMLVAAERLSATPSTVVAVPDRLGAGFLFAIGQHVWRARTWLSELTPLYTSSLPIAQVLIGLDRVYLRSPQGGLVALDPRTGKPVGPGPLPASPNIGGLAAWDAWRAVAIADLRGALLTTDAGSTWHPLPLRIEPSEVVAVVDAAVVGGLDPGRQVQWWEVRGDGQMSKLASMPARGLMDPVGAMAAGELLLAKATRDSNHAKNEPLRTFGPHPLVAAAEDGWPLTDGTALVARDGSLARVRLTDGALVDSVGNAFPSSPARCHAISLASSRSPGAFGFVCGEPRGRTVIYRWEPETARLVELRAFDNPRQVLAFGNGALAVRGACTGEGIAAGFGDEQTWCAMAPGASWGERLASGDERLVILADGRTVRLRPPIDGDLTTLRVTVEDRGQRSEQAVALPPLPPETALALRLGVWLDGFEERRPGVIGGWVDAAGSVTGIEVTARGDARVGEFIRDAGGPVTAGRWAFGWTASRRGFETTDGGMTWTKEIALPDPIASGRAIHERVCGPVGCVAAGWIRVGWGGNGPSTASEPPPYVGPPSRAAPGLALECEPLGGLAPLLAPGPTARQALGVFARDSAPPSTPSPTWGLVSEFPPFGGRSAPPLPAKALGFSVEASHALPHALRAAPLARIYAWGPKTGDWDQLGRWQVRWLWPWGGWQDVRSSTVSVMPWTSLDGARRALSVGPGTPTAWMLAGGDDPDHALLIARHKTMPTGVEILLLETDRPPIEARRASGDSLPDVEAATRVGGVWYIATTQGPGELAAMVVWSLEGAVAHEIARVPRAGFEARPAVHLARRLDGRALGLVVDGPRDELQGTALRWVAAVDLESNSVGAPEPLAPADLSDRTVSLCTGDDDGWVVDLPYPGTVRLHMSPGWESELDSTFARMRISHERTCVERMLGAVSERPPGMPISLTSARVLRGGASAPTEHTMEATVVSGSLRYALRCARR
jgi:hypothetical protein